MIGVAAMRSGAVAIAMLVLGVLLAVSFEPLVRLEREDAWLVWLAGALTLLVFAFAHGMLNAIASFCRKNLFQLDMMSWMTFIALPFCGMLIVVVIWNMVEIVAGR